MLQGLCLAQPDSACPRGGGQLHPARVILGPRLRSQGQWGARVPGVPGRGEAAGRGVRGGPTVKTGCLLGCVPAGRGVVSDCVHMCVRARVCKCVMVRVHTCDCVRGCVNSGFHSTSPLHRGRARLSGCFRAHTAAGSAETAKGWGGRCLVGGPAAPVGGIGLLGLLLVPCWVLPCHRGGWGAARWAGSFSPSLELRPPPGRGLW